MEKYEKAVAERERKAHAQEAKVHHDEGQTSSTAEQAPPQKEETASSEAAGMDAFMALERKLKAKKQQGG